jgi:CBS domain-containing protein
LLGKLTAKDFMTHPVFSISPDARIQEAAKQMLDNKIGGLPVVENEKLVGMITETDFCRLLIEIEEKQIS